MTTSPVGRRAGDDGIVIAGGGLAGQRCAEALRRAGHDGPIRMVCAEAEPPYDRPPLSKAVLVEAAAENDLAYRPGAWYNEHEIELLLSVGARRLRLVENRLDLTDGGSVRYRDLLIATGGRPRALPLLGGYDNVTLLRDRGDARRLRGVLAAGGRLAVVGAGFIGLEVAATARRVGVEVMVVEAGRRPLENVLGPELGEWFHRLHAAEGVDLRTSTTVERVIGDATVRGLVLSDGSRSEVDHVLIGVGSAPKVGWLADSGLEAARGVPVDADGRSACPHVFAAGDAAATFDAASGSHLPGSHWEAAARQGARVARGMLRLSTGEAPLTCFWTDQYGLRIQYVGRRLPGDTLAIDGEPEARSFTAAFSRTGRAVAALLVDRPHDLPAARKRIERETDHELCS